MDKKSKSTTLDSHNSLQVGICMGKYISKVAIGDDLSTQRNCIIANLRCSPMNLRSFEFSRVLEK